MSANLRIQAISGHAGPVPGEGTQRQPRVAKLIDTTTCIGCKACEVACMEWNDLPFRETVFRQHLPDHARDGVELAGKAAPANGSLVFRSRRNQGQEASTRGVETDRIHTRAPPKGVR